MNTRTVSCVVGIAALSWQAVFAAPSVEVNSVQQQYPWTNTVDIVYTVAGVTNADYFVRFTPTNRDGVSIPDVNGEAAVQVALASNGTFTARWYPETNLQYTACSMTPSVFRGASDSYMIVDLEDWTVAFEPLATQEASNERYNTDEYKTRKLVLRKVEADTYYIGGPEGADTAIGHAPNSYHAVKMAKDYYIGIFPVTQAQYSRLEPSQAKTDSKLPQGAVSWGGLRGNALAAATPVSGPIANLTKRTGITQKGFSAFDLPTESMSEVAMRAGCADLYLCGDDMAKQGEWGWYDGGYHAVGLLKPNAWGIYEACGGVWEWCRDVWNAGNLADLQKDGLKPITTGSNGDRSLRTGCTVNATNYPAGRRLAGRVGVPVNRTAAYDGFRLSIIKE